MTTQHTPGPWKFGGIHTRHIYDTSGHAICTLAAFEDRISLNKATVVANARLIASAPDLLAENERMRGLLLGIVSGTESQDRAVPALVKWSIINAARAALAKAREL